MCPACLHVSQAVIICTPNGTHADLCREAARLGKHVLIEKPLDITPAACEAAVAAAKECNVKVGVTYQRRFSPDNITVKRLLETGALGKVYAVDLVAKFFRDQAYYDQAEYRGGYAIDGGGPFIQQAVHNLDTLCWFFGLPEKVTSMLGTFAHEIEVCYAHHPVPAHRNARTLSLCLHAHFLSQSLSRSLSLTHRLRTTERPSFATPTA